MNIIKNCVKKIPFVVPLYTKWKRRINQKKKDNAVILPIKKAKRADKNLIFLIFTPVHGNLGDHAIATAEIELLNRAGKKYYEVPGKTLSYLESRNKLSVFNGNPIVVHGGGYLGTLWFPAEIRLRNIISSNPDSQILCFPNTVYYENSDFGKEEFEKAKEIYSKHRRLKLYVREKISYDLVQQLNVKSALAPDMVMSLKEDHPQLNRDGCLVCMREDIEKIISAQDEEQIKVEIKDIFGDRIKYVDTVRQYRIPIPDREKELSALFNEFKTSELVITDRLHGMIISAITGTPCIVINSKSHKVKGCYEWLKHLDYIKFCDDIHNLRQTYEDLPHHGCQYDREALVPYFDELIQDVCNLGV